MSILKKIDLRIIDDTCFTTKASEIWMFVERKLNISIPPYIKCVLKYCGYENCHTIATIEENDLKYITAEVRKVNFFSNEIDKENVLQSSNKSE